MYSSNYPQVGVAIVILRDGKMLMGKRAKMPGINTWQCPGGFMEAGESVFECGRGKVEQETGLVVHNLRYGPYTDNRFANDGVHTVSLYVVADYMGGEAIPREPDEVDAWSWVDIHDLPEPLFLPLEKLVKKHADWFSTL